MNRARLIKTGSVSDLVTVKLKLTPIYRSTASSCLLATWFYKLVDNRLSILSNFY